LIKRRHEFPLSITLRVPCRARSKRVATVLHSPMKSRQHLKSKKVVGPEGRLPAGAA